MFVETLVNTQHSTRLTPECRSYTLNSSRENLRIRINKVCFEHASRLSAVDIMATFPRYLYNYVNRNLSQSFYRTTRVRSPTEARNFLLVSASRPTLGPTQSLVQWVPGTLSSGVKRARGVMPTTHPHLVPRLSMSRSYTSSPPMCLHGV
jgi:hypothetical protein